MSIITLGKQIKRGLWSYNPLITVSISRANLLYNLHQFQRQYPNLRFAPVLKSNAYGHGLSLVASVLDEEDIAFFVVDSLFEAKVLRNDGIRSPIVVMGFVTVDNIVANSVKNVAFAITSLAQLQDLCRQVRRKTTIHLKVDTGLSRQGISPDEVEEALELIKNTKQLELDGLCSHLADADSEDERQTKSQIKTWQTVVWQVKQDFPDLHYTHLAATAGAEYSNHFESNVARLGAGLYGFNRSPFRDLKLKPALSMEAVIGAVKELPAGARIGYNGTFTAKRSMTVATIPAGYYEGIDRRLSNKGVLTVKGIHCPIVGRVSMNITTIDVSSLKSTNVGDKVTIISSNPDDPNSVQAIADMVQTVPHEIVVHIPQSLHRELR